MVFLERRIRTKRGRRRARLLAFGAATATYACLIFYASSLSDAPEMITPFFLDMDTLAHFTEFMLFGGLLFMTFANAGWRPWDAPGAIILGAVYGAVDEIHQMYIPGRTADPSDVLFDALGVVVAVVILAYLDRRFHPSPAPPRKKEMTEKS